MADPDFPNLTVWDYLDMELDRRREEYRTLYGLSASVRPENLSEESWELAKTLDRLGPAILDAVHSLRIPDRTREALREFTTEEPTRAVKEVAAYNIVDDRVDLEIAAVFLNQLSEARSRYNQLLVLVMGNPVSERAAAFLDRASRLYLFGFTAETTAMCRASLDAALQSRLPDHEMEKLGIPRPHSGYHLFHRIKAAAKAGILDEKDVILADRIRLHGNDAVHVAPGLGPDPFLLLYALVFLLRKLFPL